MSFDIAHQYNFVIDAMEVDKNHIHYLLDIKPDQSISEIVRLLKGITQDTLWKCYPEELAKQFYRSKMFWSDGYFTCSTGNASAATIKKYIEEQG